MSKSKTFLKFAFSKKRYEESRKSTFDFSDQDLESYLCPDHFEKGRLLLNAVAQVLLSSQKPLLSDNFFDIGGDSLNMVQVCLEFHSNLMKMIIIVAQNAQLIFKMTCTFRSFQDVLTLVTPSGSPNFL